MCRGICGSVKVLGKATRGKESRKLGDRGGQRGLGDDGLFGRRNLCDRL